MLKACFWTLTFLTLLSSCEEPLTHSTASPDSGILGGRPVDDNNPLGSFTVGLYDSANNSRCSGSLISSDTVLTAGHCVRPDSKMYVVFAKKFGLRVDLNIMRPASSFKAHEKWNSSRPEGIDTFDLALVKFEGGLPPGYKTVVLNSDPSIIAAPGNILFAAGFGVSEGLFMTGGGTLRYVDLKFRQMHSETEIQTVQDSKGVCSGDSGGPLVLQLPTKIIQIGVASRVGSKFMGCREFAVFTRVDYFHDWIVPKKILMSHEPEATAEDMAPPEEPVPTEVPPEFDINPSDLTPTPVQKLEPLPDVEEEELTDEEEEQEEIQIVPPIPPPEPPHYPLTEAN